MAQCDRLVMLQFFHVARFRPVHDAQVDVLEFCTTPLSTQPPYCLPNEPVLPCADAACTPILGTCTANSLSLATRGVGVVVGSRGALPPSSPSLCDDGGGSAVRSASLGSSSSELSPMCEKRGTAVSIVRADDQSVNQFFHGSLFRHFRQTLLYDFFSDSHTGL
jgi:hypothetical protein